MHRIHMVDLEVEQNGQNQVITPVVIRNSSDTLLVDCGYPGMEERLEEALLRQGIPMSEVTAVIITHHDIDHMGALEGLKRQYPALEVIAHELERTYVEGSDRSLRLVQAESGLDALPEEARPYAEQFIAYLQTMVPARVDRTVTDGELLGGCGGIEVVHTPGHMPGHISLYLPASRTMLAGDAVVIEDGRLNIANPQFTLDMEAAVASVRKLAGYDIDRLICYHGGCWQGDTREALEELALRYERGVQA